jgi:hypothetical protein
MGAKNAIGLRRFFFWFTSIQQLSIALFFVFNQDMALVDEFFDKRGRFYADVVTKPPHVVVKGERRGNKQLKRKEAESKSEFVFDASGMNHVSGHAGVWLLANGNFSAQDRAWSRQSTYSDRSHVSETGPSFCFHYMGR